MAHIGNSPASYFTAVSSDVFSANGTGNTFSLSKSISNLADIEVIVNNIQQNPFGGSYSVVGNTLTFSEAPLAGSNNIVVTYRQATIGSTIPTPNTVGNTSLQRDLSFTGNTTTQHLVPAANVTYDIGTSTMRYRDIYLSGNTINLGDLKLSTNGTAFSVANATGGVFASALGNTTITGTLTSNATTITGNVSITGYTSFTGNVDISSSDSNPVRIISTSGTTYLRIRTANTTTTYSYIALDNTSSSQGLGYIIKNGNSNGNGLANGSLYLWNDQGTDNGIEFVANGTIGTRTSLIANGSFVIRGNLGIGNTTPYNAAWTANTDQISIGGGKNYGVIHFNGQQTQNTSYSIGAGGTKFYLAYDNTISTHNIVVNSSGAVSLRNANTDSNGTGIVFPQTQAASSDPNTLDDYEEGTWTVTDRSGIGLSITNNMTARYRKVGSVVFVFLYVTYPSTGSADGAALSLPFTVGANYSYLTGRIQNAAFSGTTGLVAQCNDGTSSLYPHPSTSSASGYTNAMLSGGYLLLSGWYITSS